MYGRIRGSSIELAMAAVLAENGLATLRPHIGHSDHQRPNPKADDQQFIAVIG
jgi:hypothetical protein